MTHSFDERRLDGGMMAAFAAMAEASASVASGSAAWGSRPEAPADHPLVYFFEKSAVPFESEDEARVDYRGTFAIDETVLTKDGEPVIAGMSVVFGTDDQVESAFIEFPVSVNDAIRKVFEENFSATCDEEMKRFDVPRDVFLRFAESERWTDWDSMLK